MIVLILSSHRLPMYILEEFSKMLSESGNSKSKWPQYLGPTSVVLWMERWGDGKKQFLYLSDSVSLVWLRTDWRATALSKHNFIYSLWIKGIDTHTEQTPLSLGNACPVYIMSSRLHFSNLNISHTYKDFHLIWILAFSL